MIILNCRKLDSNGKPHKINTIINGNDLLENSMSSSTPPAYKMNEYESNSVYHTEPSQQQQATYEQYSYYSYSGNQAPQQQQQQQQIHIQQPSQVFYGDANNSQFMYG
jgi:hypothetical protein